MRETKLKESNSKVLRNVQQRSTRKPLQTIEMVDDADEREVNQQGTQHTNQQQFHSLNQDLGNNLSIESAGAQAVRDFNYQRTPRGNIRIRSLRPTRA